MISQVILKSFYKHFSTSFFAMNRQARNLTFFDTSLSHYFSTPASLSNNIEKSCHMTAFFVILRHIPTAFDIQCEKCCRLLSNHSEKSWRKTPSKNDVEIYWRKTLYNTIFFDSIWQISPKTSRRCKKCGIILAYFVEIY